MANGFPAKTSYQNGRPLGAPELAAIGAALNESAPAKVTAAGQILAGIGLNEIAALAAPLASGMSLVSDLAEPGKIKWGINPGVKFAMVQQSPGSYTLTGSNAQVGNLTLTIQGVKAGSLVIALAAGEYVQTSAGQTYVSLVGSGGSWQYLSLPNGTVIPAIYAYSFTPVADGDVTVYVSAVRPSGDAKLQYVNFFMLAIEPGG
jgi:hypothetical protein